MVTSQEHYNDGYNRPDQMNPEMIILNGWQGICLRFLRGIVVICSLRTQKLGLTETISTYLSAV
jgi:hypothetical protein